MEWCNKHNCPCTQELCVECKPHLLDKEPDKIDSFGNCWYLEEITLEEDEESRLEM